MDVINKRRSIRSYKSLPLEKEKIDLILRAAMQAPSAINQQPWKFLVVEDKKKLEEYSKCSQYAKFLTEAPCAIIFLTDKRKVKAQGMCYQDMSASVMNALIEATELKIGSCWCGVYPREDRMHLASSIFEIPEYLEPFALVCFGYPKVKEDMKFIDRYDQNNVFYEVIE